MGVGLIKRGHWPLMVAIVVAATTIACGGRDEGIGVGGRADSGTLPDAGPPDSGPAFPDTGVGTTTLALTAVVPPNGPYVGGNAVFLRGAGFTDEAVVTFDGRMVQPADIELIDDHRLQVVVPAGEPGPADVVVQVGDQEITLPAGYTYDTIFVDPNRGSVSGGQVVSVTGEMGIGFADGDTVVFGRTPCTDVTVVSDTRITCRTPPMAAGTVDVTVVRGSDATEITAKDGYTYYDGTDPFGGGLGGGPLMGSLNVTAINAASGAPVADAYVLVGEDLATEHQGLTDLRGQITFSGDDIVGDLTVHVAKHCFEKTSVVAFDASDVTVFLVPWMDPMCGMGGMPGPGRSRNGTYINGELIWRGPNEYGPNPWANIPDPRGDEIKVAYVYTTRRLVDFGNPDPRYGSLQRVLEIPPDDGGDHLGYPYRIFARPAALAVYALAGLESPSSGEFTPYVMGIARNVLGGPGEEVTGADMVMNIPLDHSIDVQLENLPMPARLGPDRFRVDANIDLGGEGILVRGMWRGTPGGLDSYFEPVWDTVRGRSTASTFRLYAHPALYDALSDGRYRIQAGWYTDDFEDAPYTVVVRSGVRDVASAVVIDDFLGIPQASAPAYGGMIPADRVLRWESDGMEPDLHVVLMIGGDGNPAWRHFAPGNVYEAPVPDLSSVPEISDISPGVITWVVYAVKIPGFTFDELSYAYLNERYWSHYAVDYFTATR